MVVMEQLVLLALLGHQVLVETEVTLDQQEELELLEIVVLEVILVIQVAMEQLVPQERVDFLD
jgi:hypothetical protein